MGDDGYSAVNLNFGFPFYDKTFNQAYMYDNGVLGFLEPNTPNSLSSWQWNSQPLNQTNAKYFIAPLWADIAPVPQTTYTTSGTLTSQKFSWNNIAEYYSRGGILRLNSFSVEIDSNGNIATKYFGINIRTSNVSIGLRGDSDYTQIGYYPYGTVLSTQGDWSANTKIAAPVIPVVKQEPIPEPVIEQPAQQEQPVQETVSLSATPTPTATQTVTTTTVTPSATAQTTQAAVETKTEKKVAAKAQQVDMSVVDAAVSIAMTSAAQSVNEQQTTSNTFSLSNITIFNKQGNDAQTIQKSGNVSFDEQSLSSITSQSDKKDPLDLLLSNTLERTDNTQEQKERGINKGIKSTTELGQEIPLFQTYSLIIPDAPFYAPKEIYRRQRVVDNARLLRSLVNDIKFEQMIDAQYQR